MGDDVVMVMSVVVLLSLLQLVRLCADDVGDDVVMVMSVVVLLSLLQLV